MPVNREQLASFAAEHETKILFDTGPRHLAGPGDGRHVTHGLAAAGWTLVSDPLNPLMVLRSDDVDRRLILDGTSHLYYWSLQSHTVGEEPRWYASFSYRTPVEIVAAVTDALVTPQPAGPKAPRIWTRGTPSVRRAGRSPPTARPTHPTVCARSPVSTTMCSPTPGTSRSANTSTSTRRTGGAPCSTATPPDGW
jgi:hypothetical protein